MGWLIIVFFFFLKKIEQTTSFQTILPMNVFFFILLVITFVIGFVLVRFNMLLMQSNIFRLCLFIESSYLLLYFFKNQVKTLDTD